MCKKNQLLEKFNNIYTHKKHIVCVCIFKKKKLPKWVYLPEYCSVDFPLLFNGIIIFQTIKLWNWNPFERSSYFSSSTLNSHLAQIPSTERHVGPLSPASVVNNILAMLNLVFFTPPPTDSNPPSKVFLLSPNPKSCLKLWSPPSLAP